MLAVVRRGSKVQSGARTKPAVADVSVVIPAFNEETTVEVVLSALSRQTLLPREVLIVDAGSNDRTVERAESFINELELRVLQRDRLNPGEARNEGVRHARCGWIALVDCGCQPNSVWLEELTAAAERTRADVVFGSYTPTCDTFFRRCAAVAYVPPPGERGIRGPVAFSMAIRREVFENGNGFPPYRASEDLIFIERLLAGGFAVDYASRAEVLWETAPSVVSTFKRFALYSKANLAAGRARYWHFGVARQYIVMSLIVLLALKMGSVALALATLAAWWLARALKAGWQKRGTFPFATLNPFHVVGAAFLLIVLDAATLAGTLFWLAGRFGGK